MIDVNYNGLLYSYEILQKCIINILIRNSLATWSRLSVLSLLIIIPKLRLTCVARPTVIRVDNRIEIKGPPFTRQTNLPPT